MVKYRRVRGRPAFAITPLRRRKLMMRAAKIADNSVTAVRDGTRIDRLVTTTNNTFTIAHNFATF